MIKPTPIDKLLQQFDAEDKAQAAILDAFFTTLCNSAKKSLRDSDLTTQ